MTHQNDTECLFDIRQDGKWGLIDRTGKVVVSPQFDDIARFEKGMAVVVMETEHATTYGYVDTCGNIIPPQFDGWGLFGEDMAFVRVGEKWGLIDRTGKVVVEPRFDNCDFEICFNEGLAAVSQSGRWGYIDKTGTFVINPQFDWAGTFREGYANIQEGDEESGKVGLIDRTGRIVISPEFEVINGFGEGLVAVRVAGKYGFIDIQGRFVIAPRFDWAGSFCEGLARVQLSWKSGYIKNGYIDTSGKIVIPPNLEEIDGEIDWTEEGLALVRVGEGEEEKYGYINEAGKFVIPPQFEDASFFNEGLAAVMVQGKWGFIDTTGKIVIEPQFEDQSEFHEGLASMRIGDEATGKYGYIDTTGKFVIEPQFDNASYFNKGLANVAIGGTRHTGRELGSTVASCHDGKWGYIDRNGKYIWHPTS
jgi:hypothetical protein